MDSMSIRSRGDVIVTGPLPSVAFHTRITIKIVISSQTLFAYRKCIRAWKEANWTFRQVALA